MTSWFIGVEASVIFGGLLYSKGIRFLFPVGKRLVLAARRPLYIEKIWFEPVPRQQKSGQPKLTASTILGWAVRGSACFAGGRCGASRLARCAGKRSRVYSAPRPDGFEPMKGRQKRRPTEVDRLNNLWVGRQGFEPWTLGLKVPCSAS